MEIWSLIGGVVGGALSGTGVFLWFANTAKDRWMTAIKAQADKDLEQLKNELLLEQHRLQLRLDQVSFVSKTQFDAEFNAMRDIFALATELKIHMAGLRPMFEQTPANETSEDRVKRLWSRHDDVSNAYNPFANQLESLSPFYPSELYGALAEIRKAAALELNQIKTNHPETFSPEWYMNGEDNRNRLLDAYTRAARVIRDRLEHLSVVPS